jgi:transcriptional regulator GlxA family with amidase domain
MINRFETAVRAHVRQRLSIADLCRIAGISQRSLSRAFQSIGPTTALQHVQALRLSELREVLLSESEPGTVTEVALRFGFSELGRLAGRYRSLFGESPSESRRRALSAAQVAAQNES